MEFHVVHVLVQIALKVDYIPLVMHCHYAHRDVTVIPMHASNQNV